jgi:hypothetical protein
MDNEIVFRGFPLPWLQDAFDKLIPPGRDWRGPIDAVVFEVDQEACVAAVAYFTGCNAAVADAGPLRVRITAAGYRNGPCGP